MSKPVKFLLVEDNATDVELILRILHQQGVRQAIKVCGDGVDALEFLFGANPGGADAPPAQRPRVVVLDLKLPKVDGLEVLRRLKGDPQTRDIPVVVLTSSQDERDVREAYRLGVNSYVVKPVQFERFSTVIREISLYWLKLNETTD